MLFSQIVANSRSAEQTLPPPAEAAFAIHVHHRVLPPLETWIDGTHSASPLMAPGAMCIFDLRASPVALVVHPLDFSRVHIKSATFGDLAYHRGLSAFELNVAPFGHNDPIIYNLTLALKSRLAALGDDIDSVFTDSVALALVDRFIATYAGGGQARTSRGTLSHAHYCRVSEFVNSKLAHTLSLADIASIVDMPPERFSRAFKRLMGIPVHQWLMMRRVEKAKDLLRSTDLSISQIAFDCGFVDQSHLTRVLRKYSATTPRQWRLGSRS